MKIWNYVFSAITMMLFLQFAGIGTPMGSLFEDFFSIDFDEQGNLNQTDITGSGFLDYFFDPDAEGASGFFAILGGLGVAAGLLATGRSDIAIKAGASTAVLFAFVPTLYFAVTYGLEAGISGWALAILGVIFIPYTLGFLIALIEFVAGGTTD